MSDQARIAVTLVRVSGDGSTRADRMAVPYEAGMTVLDVLTQIYRRVDPTLAFRHTCHIGRCACCMATVDGKQVLTCRHPARDGIVVEPPRKFEPIRDLVCDFQAKKPT